MTLPHRTYRGNSSEFRFSSPLHPASCAYFPAFSYSFRRSRHVAITALGVAPVFLGKDLQNYYGIGINTVEQTPMSTAVIDSQLMASCANARHRARLRHRQRFTALNGAVGTRLRGAPLWKTRGLNRAVKPCQRPTFRTHQPG